MPSVTRTVVNARTRACMWRAGIRRSLPVVCQLSPDYRRKEVLPVEIRERDEHKRGMLPEGGRLPHTLSLQVPLRCLGKSPGSAPLSTSLVSARLQLDEQTGSTRPIGWLGGHSAGRWAKGRDAVRASTARSVVHHMSDVAQRS